MTQETRKRLARHYRAMGRLDHKYVKEFPNERPGKEELAKKAQLDNSTELTCPECGKILKSRSGLVSHMKKCKGD